MDKKKIDKKAVEELYEGLIRLPKDEIINLMERVAYYFKQKGGRNERI